MISRVIEKIQLRHEATDLRALMVREAGREGMIGTSREMVHLYRLIEKVAPLDCPVIMQGESGTGKELVARAIHRLSLRRKAPHRFVQLRRVLAGADRQRAVRP